MAAQDEMSDTNNNDQVTRSSNRNTSGAKPRRVRTGCLTCRERHLKCDEGLPTCLNCRKSGRECKRGVRLNFIDTQCRPPPLAAPQDEWHVAFHDDSREIASEYTDGLSKYKPLEQDMMAAAEESMAFDFSQQMPNAPALAHQSLPSIQGMDQNAGHHGEVHNFYDESQHAQHGARAQHTQSAQLRHETLVLHHHQAFTHQNGEGQEQEDQPGPREILDNQDETLYMQVFVEEVGAWMDSMDNMKHVRRLQ